jgi:hypothetical protein
MDEFSSFLPRLDPTTEFAENSFVSNIYNQSRKIPEQTAVDLKQTTSFPLPKLKVLPDLSNAETEIKFLLMEGT